MITRRLIASFLTGAVIASAIGCNSERVTTVVPDVARAIEVRQEFAAESSGENEESGGATSEPTGWATLRGRFMFDGSAPPRPSLTAATTKDSEVCAPGGTPPLSELLVVADDGGIRDVVIFLDSKIAAEEPWTHPDAAPGKTDEIIFDQKQCVFLSHVIGMQASQALRILNSDPMGHNTNIQPKSNPAFNQNIPAGGFAIYQPAKPENGPAPVACSVHPWMNSFLLIRENSYFAVSQADGSFEIPNLPAGVELEFRVWQEAANFVQAVTVNGENKKWSKGRFTVMLEPDAVTELQVTVSKDNFSL
jgi:hypothetical protein